MKKATFALALLLFTTGCVSVSVQTTLAATECAGGEVAKVAIGGAIRYFCRTPDGAVRAYGVSDLSGRITSQQVIFEPDGATER